MTKIFLFLMYFLMYFLFFFSFCFSLFFGWNLPKTFLKAFLCLNQLVLAFKSNNNSHFIELIAKTYFPLTLYTKSHFLPIFRLTIFFSKRCHLKIVRAGGAKFGLKSCTMSGRKFSENFAVRTSCAADLLREMSRGGFLGPPQSF